MMSLNQINHQNARAVERAAKNHTRPAVYTGDRDRFRPPYTGDVEHKDWKPSGVVFFVDSSGMGAEDEPALTYPQFLAECKIGNAYAVISAGQFQVYVREFEKRD